MVTEPSGPSETSGLCPTLITSCHWSNHGESQRIGLGLTKLPGKYVMAHHYWMTHHCWRALIGANKMLVGLSTQAKPVLWENSQTRRCWAINGDFQPYSNASERGMDGIDWIPTLKYLHTFVFARLSEHDQGALHITWQYIDKESGEYGNVILQKTIKR